MNISVEDLKKELAKSYKGDLDIIDANTLLRENIDSLDMLDFYMNIEESYNLTIPDEDIEKLKTLNDFILYLENKR
ncbi:MAG: acyl carrier protein [Ignavibacteriae bacterium]|nr:acyl carrier protein [Ignavibacteriota bacterium]